MGYAIVGYFDEISDRKIKTLWDGMAKNDVDDYLITSENNPHIKFVMYDDLNLDIVKELLSNTVKSVTSIPIQFKSYSFYPNEKPFVCIDMAVSYEILDLQKKIKTCCNPYAKPYDVDFFEQGIWKPDCQLTVEFKKEKLCNAVQYLSNTSLPFYGSISRIGIIKFHPAKQLFEYNLV